MISAASRKRPAPTILKATQKPKKPVNDGQRVGRTARDVEVNRDVLGYAAVRGISAGERTTADRAGAHGNHELGRRHRSVGLSERELHVGRHRPGDDDAVGVTRGGHELDSEAAEIEDDVARRYKLGLAPVAASS